MSSQLDKIKLDLISNNCQVAIFNTNGSLLESCNTLFTIDAKRSVYEQFDFLKSLEELIPTLPLREKLAFGAVEWEEQVQGFFAISLERKDENTLQWVIQDNSHLKNDTLNIQQERNDATINEEVLTIQRKYLEMEKELLRYKNEELERVQAFKTQFFAEVSHEMRTPLNSISGLISLLQEGTQDRSPEYLSALRATSNHLNSIINDILDLSKVEAGKLVFDSKPFDLRESLQNIVTGFSLLVQEKGLQLKLAADDNVPALLVGDSIRLSQIIYNLLGNALKFTEKGYVSLAVTNLSQSPEVCELGFELIDTGKGMSQEGITQILEPYGQAEGQSYQQFGGTGLGMGIARELIQLMGGELTITSKLGSGTKIAFAIKLIADKDTPISTKVTELNLSHLKVLVAEDDLVTQMVLKDTLAQFHITNVHFVSNQDALREQLQETAFDVILSDLNLADGSAADVFIDCKDKVTSPIIFLSGDSKEKVSELNALDNWQFLLKPVDAMELGKRLSEVDKIPKIDLSNLHGAAHQNTDLVKELVVIILETLPQELDRIEEAVRQQDSKLIQKILHKIGPSISYLGIPALIDARSMLYDELASGTNKDADLDVFSMQVRRALAILAKMEL